MPSALALAGFHLLRRRVLAVGRLAGSVLLNGFKEELPHGRRSSFGWFTGGLALYAALLTLTTCLAGWRLAIL